MAKYCDGRVYLSVCLFVCLCVHLFMSIALELHIQSSANSFYMLPMAMARSYFGSVAICYMLSVLWMTLYLHIMGRMY